MWKVVFSLAVARKQIYSSNPVCVRNNCINPIFPALSLAGVAVMEDQELRSWSCVEQWQEARHNASFCGNAIDYRFSISGATVSQQLIEADQKAILAFTSHLTGMGMDIWEHTEPWRSNTPSCVQSVWRLVCYAYIPKCHANVSTYMRPCRSACEDFIRECSVECCDEGVQCLFTHAQKVEGGLVETRGYVDHIGSSVFCTGDTRSSSSRAQPFWLLIVLVLAMALLQGCDHWGGYVVPNEQSMDVSTQTSWWRRQPDYTLTTQAIGQHLNSCMTPGVGITEVCSGHGTCRQWTLSTPVWVCRCGPAWAGMECNVRRYSQSTAWILSLFFGYLGVDLVYLGFPVHGFAKLVSLGGCGFWWLLDIIRIGAGPVYAKEFRVVEDLPHWIFVICTVSVFLTLGFACTFASLFKHIRRRRRKASLSKVL